MGTVGILWASALQAADLSRAEVENWLPITREELDLDVILRVYVPDLEKMKSWKAGKAEKVTP